MQTKIEDYQRSLQGLSVCVTLFQFEEGLSRMIADGNSRKINVDASRQEETGTSYR
jgi:hypothetical protein